MARSIYDGDEEKIGPNLGPIDPRVLLSVRSVAYRRSICAAACLHHQNYVYDVHANSAGAYGVYANDDAYGVHASAACADEYDDIYVGVRLPVQTRRPS